MPTFLIRHLHKKTPKYSRKTCSHSPKIRKFASVITPEKVHIFWSPNVNEIKNIVITVSLTDTSKSCSPRPSSTKTRIKTYNSLDFCYEIVISETILKKIAGSQEFGTVYQTFSSRQHILLSVCRLMSVQSAQVFVSEYAQKHPNVSSEFSRDYRTSYEFLCPHGV